jgi:hypothetical protein
LRESLFKNLFVRRLIETNNQNPALAQHWRAQIARAADQQFRQSGFIRFALAQIEVHHLPAFAGVDFINVFDESKRFLF